MIERIIAFSARNRFVVLVLTGAAIFAGVWSISHIALDALPDLSDTQVIVYSRWDRSPDIIEDQVTYPIITAMLGAPKVKAIRGFSDFGFSYVYVIFEEGTDLYWARSRDARVPLQDPAAASRGRAARSSGPTPLVWAGCTSTRSWTTPGSALAWRICDRIQDWTVRYDLQSVPGRGRGRQRRRLRPPVPGHRRPESPGRRIACRL